MNLIIVCILPAFLFNIFGVDSPKSITSLFQGNHFWSLFFLLNSLNSLSFASFNIGHAGLHLFGDHYLDKEAIILHIVWVLFFCDIKEAVRVGLWTLVRLIPCFNLHQNIIKRSNRIKLS